MIPHSGSRLAVTVVMLVLQTLIFIFELLIFTKRVRRRRWYRPFRQLVGPLSFAFLAAVLIPVMFAKASNYVEDAAEQCNASVDGDVAGQGAQIAVWAQVGVLLVISILGSFHTSATGAKEVGAGLVLTHVSLSIALLTQMRLGTLSSADAIIGSMILDAQNVGLSIQLAAKETLASRWQVQFEVLAQTFGLVVIPVLVSNFTRGVFANDDCRCLTVFWWAWLSSCGSSPAREIPVFWTYYACRCVGFVQTCFHSQHNTSKFDRAEKSERAVMDNWDGEPDAAVVDEEQQLSTGLMSGAQGQGDAGNNNCPGQARNDIKQKRSNRGTSSNRGIRLRHVTHVYRRQNGQVVCFREYPATVTLMCTVYAAFSLTSMATVQTTVTNFNLKPPSPIDSVGQTISLIVAAATLGRAAWLFFMLFRDETRSSDRNFVRPFKWRLNEDRLRAFAVKDYVLCSPPKQDTNILSLGSLLTEPFDPSSQIGANPHAPEGVENSIVKKVGFGVSSPATLWDIIGRNMHSEQLTVDWLSTWSFEPSALSSAPYVEDRLQDPLLVAHGELPLYMVTGVTIARGVSIYSHISNKADPLTYPGLKQDKGLLFSSESEVLLAYRLHIVPWSRRRRAFVLKGGYNPREDW